MRVGSPCRDWDLGSGISAEEKDRGVSHITILPSHCVRIAIFSAHRTEKIKKKIKQKRPT